MPENFPNELRQFVEQHIESVQQLEALLLLRTEPSRQWNAAEVAKSLYVPEEVAKFLLTGFIRRGFAVSIDSDQQSVVAYHPRDQVTDDLIGQLQQMYHDRRVAVISLIYSKPLNRVQTFADAFRFNRENPK